MIAAANPFTAPACAETRSAKSRPQDRGASAARALGLLVAVYLVLDPVALALGYARAQAVVAGAWVTEVSTAAAITGLGRAVLLLLAAWWLTSRGSPTRTIAATAGAGIVRTAGAIVVAAAALRLLSVLVGLPPAQTRSMGVASLIAQPVLVVGILSCAGAIGSRLVHVARVPSVRTAIFLVLASSAAWATYRWLVLPRDAAGASWGTEACYVAVSLYVVAWLAQIRLFWRIRRALAAHATRRPAP